MSLNSDFQKLLVDGLVTLYELDASRLGAGILRFHGHIAFQEWQEIYSLTNSEIDTDTESIGNVIEVEKEKIWKRNIIWQGHTYEPMALETTGLEMRTDGKASSPSLSMANNIAGVQNAVSAYCLQFDDFSDAKLTVIVTRAKYLDAENFSLGNPSASNESEQQLWYIEQKTIENHEAVSFELSNPIDQDGRKLPVRQISNICHWCIMGNYRAEECGYTGAAMFTEKNEPTDNPAFDKCVGSLSSCKIRNNEGSFAGFPASNLIG